METTSVLIFAVGLAVIVLIALIVHFFNIRSRMAGYAELKNDLSAIQHALDAGEVIRSANDVVVAGNLGGFRTLIRISHEDDEPAINVRMDVPTTVDLTIAPKNFPMEEFGQRIKIESPVFDNEWILRTRRVTEARLLLANDSARQHIMKLCCSPDTLVSLKPGVFEQSEMVFPQGSVSGHVINHLASMRAVAEKLAAMPGAADVITYSIPRTRKTETALVVVLALAAVGLGVYGALQYVSSHHVAAGSAVGVPDGIPGAELAHIPNFTGWRLCVSSDFDSALVNWLAENNLIATGRLEGDFSGGGIGADHAYLLANASGEHRLVVLLNNQVKLDQKLSHAVLIARIPKGDIKKFRIQTGSAPTGNADGILVVGDAANRHSGIVFSFHQNALLTTIPDDYKSVKLN